MDYLLNTFKAVSVIFAISAVITGAQAVVDPIGFSKSFGLRIDTLPTDVAEPVDNKKDESTSSRATVALSRHRNLTMSYASLMGIRQLATGVILMAFAYQRKWTEIATILAIIGIVVAGTDGIFLSLAQERRLGQLHAIPGALIAALASAVLYQGV